MTDVLDGAENKSHSFLRREGDKISLKLNRAESGVLLFKQVLLILVGQKIFWFIMSGFVS
jgi:hypothetical protein